MKTLYCIRVRGQTWVFTEGSDWCSTITDLMSEGDPFLCWELQLSDRQYNQCLDDPETTPIAEID